MIIYLMKDGGRPLEMGLKGRRIAEAHNLKQIAKKTEELYEKALEDI